MSAKGTASVQPRRQQVSAKGTTGVRSKEHVQRMEQRVFDQKNNDLEQPSGQVETTSRKCGSV